MMSAVVYPQQIEFSRYSRLNRNTFTNIRRLRDKTKVKKYFVIDDTHRGLVVQISPNMLSGIIYAGMQI